MFKRIQHNFNDLLEKAGAITENGTSYFKGMIGQINLFSSSEALVIKDQLHDETHYLLVPDRDSPQDYDLYIKRVIPEGYSSDNDLPKQRVFQLPNQASLQSLEQLLIQNISSEKLQKLDTSSPLAERLDAIATEIDHKSNHITNGLIIIGGIVAVANPLLGIGIAAKALLPSLTSKVTSSGLDHISDYFKKRQQTSAQKEAQHAAKKELKQLDPIININPALSLLSQSLHTSDPDHDPLTESIHLWDDLRETKEIFIATEAITSIYADRIKSNNSPHLHPNDIAWLKSLSKCIQT